MLLDKIKSFIKKYYLALIFAAVVGVFSAGPQILSIYHLGTDYKGILFSQSDDDYTYLARMQEILDGHPLASSPYFYEYKNQTPLVLPFGEYFYAIPAVIFHIRLADVLIISKFLFPAVLFFLVYLLVFRLSFDTERPIFKKINAVAGGLFVALGYELFNYRFALRLLSGRFRDLYLLPWVRPINPITGALILFVFLLLVWTIITKRQSSRWWLIAFAGVIFGLSIYYFFAWGIILSITGILLLLLFLFKEDYEAAKELLVIILIGILVDLPFLFSILNNLGSAGGRETAMRTGMFFAHTPVFNRVLIASSLIFLPCFIYEYYRKRKKGKGLEKWWWFCLSLLLGGLLAFNQQIITGRTIWVAHFVQYTIPLSITALIVLLFNFFRPKFFKVWLAAMICIIALSLAMGIRSVQSYGYDIDNFKKIQRFAPVFEWLDKNSQTDCVVLSMIPRISYLVPALTHCNVYLSLSTFPGAPAEDRVYHNLLVSLRLKGIKADNAENYLSNNRSDILSVFYTDWTTLLGNGQGQYFDEKIKETAKDYKEFLKNDFMTEVRKYKADYFLSDGEVNAETKDLLPSLQMISNFDGLILYKF